MSEIMAKRPDEVLDYVFDFTRWLSIGDIISAVTATITSTPSGGTVAIDHVTHDEQTATIWAKAGTDGETAEIVAQITTALGRTKEAVLRLRIRD